MIGTHGIQTLEMSNISCFGVINTVENHHATPISSKFGRRFFSATHFHKGPMPMLVDYPYPRSIPVINFMLKDVGSIDNLKLRTSGKMPSLSHTLSHLSSG